MITNNVCRQFRICVHSNTCRYFLSY